MVWPTTFDLVSPEVNVPLLDDAKCKTPLEHCFRLDVKKPIGGCRFTAIMSTIGPASRDQGILENMMAAGMNMARLNASYDTIEQRAESVALLRRAAAAYGRKMGYIYPLAIAIDLNGPVLRTGCIDVALGGKIELEAGDQIKLTTDDIYRDKGSHHAVFINYEHFSEKVKKGNIIYIDNELLKLRVEMVSGSTTTCRIQRGGVLISQRDVCVPGVLLGMPIFTDRDVADIQFAVHEQIDIVIASHLETGHHVKQLREMLGERGRKIAIVCKIQSTTAFNNLNEIMEESDSVIVARQELGTDIESSKLIIAQKNIIAKSMSMGKPCGVLAQVLQSMNTTQIPLRAEILDAGNCVVDGADYLLLSAETAIGKYPVEAVRKLAAIVKEAETCLWYRQLFVDLIDQINGLCTPVEGTAVAAVLASRKLCAGAIVVATTSGRSARLVSRFRPCCPILAVTRYPSVARQLNLSRAVIPILYEGATDSDWEKDVDKRVDYCIHFGMHYGFLKPGNPIVTITGWKHASGFTNTMRLIYVRDLRENSKTSP